MSTEQDKDSFSLKRNRGGEGGLDILGGPAVQLGSPDKKRRKSSTQQAFSLSEYAPPPNPSADHLIAANPFDDNYNSPSLKLTPANPYFGHYPALSRYGPPRMPAHRTPAPYVSHQTRNQQFSQNPTGFHRTQRFSYAENPNYVQSLGGGHNNSVHFGAGEHISRQNLNQSSPGFAEEGNTRKIDFTKSNTQDQSETVNKNPTQKRVQNVNCEEDVTQDSKADGKLNGVLHTHKKSDRVYKASNNKSSRRSASSFEPVYPCGICLSEVNDDQEAILCEASCQKWFHRVCTGMTETAYNLLTAESAAVWGCDSCMEEKGVQLFKNREHSGTPSLPGGQS